MSNMGGLGDYFGFTGGTIRPAGPGTNFLYARNNAQNPANIEQSQTAINLQNWAKAQQMQQSNNLRNQLMQSLLSMDRNGQYSLNNSAFGGAFSPIDFGGIGGALDQAQNIRNQNFAAGSTGSAGSSVYGNDLNSLVNSLKQMSSGGSEAQQNAYNAEGMAGINQAYKSARKDLTSQFGGAQNSRTAQAQQMELLKSRLGARQDLARNAANTMFDRQMSAGNLLNTTISGAQGRDIDAQKANMSARYNEALQRTGNPELRAQLMAQIAQANQNSQMQYNQIAGQRLAQIMQMLQ